MGHMGKGYILQIEMGDIYTTDRDGAPWGMGHMGDGAHEQWGTWAIGHMGISTLILQGSLPNFGIRY